MCFKGYQESYVDKLDSLDEAEKFLKRYQLLKLTQEETDNLNRFLASKETELAKNNTRKKIPFQIVLCMNSTKHL
jgi:hypothetical protein